jgi:uncharacterized protein YdhG (YjbR/CyaY superfamily)
MKKAGTGRDARPAKPAKDVDSYLAGVPEPGRQALKKLRATIKAAAPKAVEGISYGMPGYKQNGYLGGFAAFKDHLSFFPGTVLKAFDLELKGFPTTKGGIHFTPEHPLPAALVKKIITARIKQIEARGRY